MAVSASWVEALPLMDAWRCASGGSGVRSVLTPGRLKQLMSHADNLATSQLVSGEYTFFLRLSLAATRTV